MVSKNQYAMVIILIIVSALIFQYAQISGKVVDNCEEGTASIVIGSNILDSFRDENAYVGEDENNPDWVWSIGNLATSGSTHGTSSDSDPTGPFIGIKNDFKKTSIGDEPISIGECYNLPNNYIQICLDSLKYDDEKIEITIEPESPLDTTQAQQVPSDIESLLKTSAKSIYIKSSGDKLSLSTSTFNVLGTDSQSGTETKRIYLVMLDSSKIALFYKGTSDSKLNFFGYWNRDQDGTRMNFASYSNTDIGFNDDSTPQIYIEPLDLERISQDIPISDDNFDNLGASGSAEKTELTWTDLSSSDSIDLGSHDTPLRTKFGITIKSPEGKLNSNQLILTIPEKRVEVKVIIKSPNDEISKNILLGNPITTNGFSSKLDSSDLSDLTKTNIKFQGAKHEIEETLLLSTSNLNIETALTAQQLNYEDKIYLEVLRSRIRYYVFFKDSIDISKASASKPATFKFLNTELSIRESTSSEIKTLVAGSTFLNKGQSKTINGKVITLLAIDTNSKIRVDVDGDIGIIDHEQTKIINEIEIYNENAICGTSITPTVPQESNDCISGCQYEDNCIQVGEQFTIVSINTYCDLSLSFLPLKENGEACIEDYECELNICNEQRICGENIEEPQEPIREIPEPIIEKESLFKKLITKILDLFR